MTAKARPTTLEDAIRERFEQPARDRDTAAADAAAKAAVAAVNKAFDQANGKQ